MSGRPWDWKEEVKNSGPLREVALDGGGGGASVNGWSSPPGNLFPVRGTNYFAKKTKSPAAPEWLMQPLGMDWLRSGGRLDHVLARPDNRIMAALRRAQARGQALKTFVFAVNLQVPGREHHSAVFYYATEEPIPAGSLLYRFVHGDDNFRNSRFKLVNRIVKGPWIVRTTVGNHGACLLGRALTCRYLKGENYLEIDVDVASSAIANAIVHLALGYVTAVAVDIAFIIEAQTEEELPERVVGAVRIQQIEMGSAVYVDANGNRFCNPNPNPSCNPSNLDKGQGSGGGGFEWRKRGRSGKNNSRVEDEEEAKAAGKG